MVQVKICGIKSAAEARWAIEAGADALGFIFVPGSRRYINPEEARAISSDVPSAVRKVGVFANSSPDQVADIARLADINTIQLHGSETAQDYIPIGLPLVKALRIPLDCFPTGVSTRASTSYTVEPALFQILKTIEDDAQYVQGFLLDSVFQGRFGGTGQPLPWQSEPIRQIAGAIKKLKIPLILAGGLTPQNVCQAISELQPDAVDVSSGVEQDGVKSRRLIETFVKQVKGGGSRACAYS